MRLLPRGNRSIAVVNREERWLAAAVALARSPSLALRQQSRVQAHDAGPRLPVQKPSDQPDKAKALHIAGFLSFWSPSWFQAGSNVSKSEAISDHLRPPNSSENAREKHPGGVQMVGSGRLRCSARRVGFGGDLVGVTSRAGV